MSKSTLAKIESNKDFYVYFGSRRSGTLNYEFKKLQENYNILKKTNDGLIYTKNCLEMEKGCLQQRIDKAIEYIDKTEFSGNNVLYDGNIIYYNQEVLKCLLNILKGSEE